MLFDRLRPAWGAPVPYDMFERDVTDAEARRAKRMESIYHVGQERIWDGRKVLAELVAKHGAPRIAARERHALTRVFSIIMWGELAAWRISAQLADVIVPLEGKLAAASQVHDEARHFYVMHDYLDLLGEKPPKLEPWSRRVLAMTLNTKSLAKKLLGMQLTIETIALTIFQKVRELEVEPVLTGLLPFYERDEARHVGLGVQMLPPIMKAMSVREHVDLAFFNVDLLISTLCGLKEIEPDLEILGVDPREIVTIGTRKNQDVAEAIRAEFPWWPEDTAVMRVIEGATELLFPADGGQGRHVPLAERVRGAFAVAAKLRPGVTDRVKAERSGRGRAA